jgi:endonuclease YncB( thermonuclease family)
MAIYLLHFSWLAAAAIALSSITTTVAATEYKVLSVGDGDTIRVSGNTGVNKTTVRLACIDAPETSQAPYGNAARQALQAQLPIGTEVSLRTKATDRYGRTVAEVLKGTTNINQHWCNLVLLLFTGNTSKAVTVKPIHALKMKHV